jgi:hypothetical protein
MCTANYFEISFPDELCPANMEIFQKWVAIFRSSATVVEIRAIEISMPLRLTPDKDVHRRKLFPEYCQELRGCPQI